MKEMELRKHAKCSVCKNFVLASGLPLFYTVKIERFGIDFQAVQRQQGLTMQLGMNAHLAHVMGPDEDMAKPMMEPVTVTVCETCSTKDVMIGFLSEIGYEEAQAAIKKS